MLQITPMIATATVVSLCLLYPLFVTACHLNIIPYLATITHFLSTWPFRYLAVHCSGQRTIKAWANG